MAAIGRFRLGFPEPKDVQKNPGGEWHSAGQIIATSHDLTSKGS